MKSLAFVVICVDSRHGSKTTGSLWRGNKKKARRKKRAINCMNKECIAVSNRESPRCRLRNGDVSIEQVQNFKYLESFSTEHGKFDTKIRKCIWREKDASQKRSKVIRNRKMLETKSVELLSNTNLLV